MADQSDVENVLVTLIADALYPSGSDSPSVIGADCKIFRGWPAPGTLDTDLAAGRVNVTVFPAGGSGQNTTRFASAWIGPRTIPELSVSVDGNTVAFSGTATAGQVAGVIVNESSYVYRTKPGDTPAIVAASLAASIRSNWFANLAGTTITIPGATRLLARTGADIPASQEIRRQQQRFRISCWCPTPVSRDLSAKAIDQCLAALPFVDFRDGSQGRLRYHGTLVFDQSQDALLYRRDLLYDVEYPTIVTASSPSMLFGQIALNATDIIA